MNAPSKLGFLNEPRMAPAEAFRKASWLTTDFNASIWSVNFNGDPILLNWKVALDNNSYLTDDENLDLLNGLKYSLIGATRNSLVEMANSQSVETLRRKFYAAVGVIDCLLIHATELKLLSAGLAGLSEGDMKWILNKLSSESSVAEALYDWSGKLCEYAQVLLNEIPGATISSILEENPSMLEISSTQLESNELDVSVENIPRIRAALYYKGHYDGHRGAGYTVNSVRISNEIYKNTIRGGMAKPRHEILSFYPLGESYKREMDGVRVTSSSGSLMAESQYRLFYNFLYGMGLLKNLGMPGPSERVLDGIKGYTPELAKPGRFVTVPSGTIFKLFKGAVEFHYELGPLVVEGFCRLARYCDEHDKSLTSLTDEQVVSIIGSDLERHGVTKLGLGCRNTSDVDGSGLENRKGAKEDYFGRLRSNVGLLELVYVYIGVIQFVVGLLMARRIDELLQIPSAQAFDSTSTWLMFRREKSTTNTYGLRKYDARPIDPLAVQMLAQLVRLQEELIDAGFSAEAPTIFSVPSLHGRKVLYSATKTSMNTCFDFLCDYFESEVNEVGLRYYVRQHQLRRVAALLFFHAYGKGRIDTLRWILGHNDIEHAWRYITDATDGASLRGAEAQIIAENFFTGDVHNYKSLRALMKEQFGTDDVRLVDQGSFSEHLEHLMSKGIVKFEPVFVLGAYGKEMQVLVHVKGA